MDTNRVVTQIMPAPVGLFGISKRLSKDGNRIFTVKLPIVSLALVENAVGETFVEGVYLSGKNLKLIGDLPNDQFKGYSGHDATGKTYEVRQIDSEAA